MDCLFTLPLYLLWTKVDQQLSCKWIALTYYDTDKHNQMNSMPQSASSSLGSTFFIVQQNTCVSDRPLVHTAYYVYCIYVNIIDYFLNRLLDTWCQKDAANKKMCFSC